MKKSIEMFLAQSYRDAWTEYQHALLSQKAQRWDWVAITASNEKQADVYRTFLKRRDAQGLLPRGTRFIVVPDVEGNRIGSGGATLNVLRAIADGLEPGENLLDARILLLHAGGDARRIPQYSACGKLLTPIPRMLPDGGNAFLLDELLICAAGIAGRTGTGMLVMPGDTNMLFNPLQLDLKMEDACALSMKAGVEEGVEHGVFVVANGGKTIAKFLHKRPEAALRAAGAVNGSDMVDIDTGAFWLGKQVVRALFSLISRDGKLDRALCGRFISAQTPLSLYADFIYPLAADSTLEGYLCEASEGALSESLSALRNEIWTALNGIGLSIERLSPSKYLHIGSARQLHDLYVRDIGRYEYLGWGRLTGCNLDSGAGTVINSMIADGAQVASTSYIENCYVKGGISVGQNVILSGLTLENSESIPDNVVMHCLKQEDGRFVCRILGIDDNPKSGAEGSFLGTTLGEFFKTCEAEMSANTLWDAPLYPACATVAEAVSSALLVWRIAQKRVLPEDVAIWRQSERFSLQESFAGADTEAMFVWQNRLEHHVRVKRCLEILSEKGDMHKALACFGSGADLETEAEILLRNVPDAPFSLKIRVFLALSMLCEQAGKALCGKSAEAYEDLCYAVIRDNIVEAVERTYSHDRTVTRFVCAEKSVSLPVRVNFCGSPSDAAPYCLEYGGTMFDAALSLKGKLPIRATARRLDEPIIVFESVDQNQRAVYTSLGKAISCGDPFDSFALHKAVVVAAGVLPRTASGQTLDEILNGYGGGLCLTTEVDVPKGSGLGTSSLIAAACIQALHEITGQSASEQQIYSEVFSAEQLMNTGGGWQDQVGGFTPGFKLERSEAGALQSIQVDYAALKPEIEQAIQARFALIFSGQRRLARNVLRQELNQCIRSDPNVMKTLDRIRNICVLMKFELERGNITRFGQYITEQFELVKTLDKGASNTCIEFIFDSCADLIDGKAICGAGGGGFLQVVLKEGVTKDMLAKRLQTVFADTGVEVWESAFLF